MTYSEPQLLLALQHSLKDMLGASSSTLPNKLQGKGQARLNLLNLVGRR